MGGILFRLRIRIGTRIVTLGGHVAAALLDLGFGIAPEVGRRAGATGRRFLPGLIVLALLAGGLAATWSGSVYIVQAVLPHREFRP